MNQKIYVIGHINPDTDSVCSAIAYADLKNRLTSTGDYIPKRAGEITEETKYALQKFHIDVPGFIQDVGTQVSDIEIRQTKGVHSGISLKKAWNLMKDIQVATLPVTCGNQLEGIITVKDIATANMDIYDSQILASSRTSYRNIIETLDGTLVVGDENKVIESGKILIAAGNPEILENFIEDDDIVILSNRYESQLCAIEMNAGCIIVGMDSPIAKTIKKLAEEKGCTIISTPHDTYTTARLINQSTPIHYFMKTENLITFETHDFTDDVKKAVTKVRHRDFPVLDVYGSYCGMISRRSLLDIRKKKVILVDHNEKSQAVDGLESAEILEIIDHHRLGNLETISPVFFRNQPVGCTATIIYQMYLENNIEIQRDIAGILCAAILTDTLMFRSPTCTGEDRKAAENLAGISGIDVREFAENLFHAGSNLEDKTPQDMIFQDFKKFSINEIVFGVGQKTFMNVSDLQNAKSKILSFFENEYHKQDLDMLFFMLTNILEESTELLYWGENSKEIAESAMKTSTVEHSLHLEGVVSRKKQVVPALMSAFQQQ